MSIITKTGDRGQTSLYSGERIWKDDARVDAYGSIDELDAHIGDAKHLLANPELQELLIDLQNKLYRVMGELASPTAVYPYPICENDVDEITERIKAFETQTPVTGFVIPGSTPASAKLDICRTIARRAERRVISLSRHEEVSEEILSFMNRLSDFFFIMARHIEAFEGALTYKRTSDRIECKGDR
ncbi:MAG: cob(I)yrinic acid a,c-diamide adenosyltransferase [Candidatus Cloacimonadaceae bacterium]|nr:cob(I)yrinic acid a,c-diamide adenosyltransferase [Candidatus Cloacimonadaceae bacterium]